LPIPLGGNGFCQGVFQSVIGFFSIVDSHLNHVLHHHRFTLHRFFPIIDSHLNHVLHHSFTLHRFFPIIDSHLNHVLHHWFTLHRFFPNPRFTSQPCSPSSIHISTMFSIIDSHYTDFSPSSIHISIMFSIIIDSHYKWNWWHQKFHLAKGLQECVNRTHLNGGFLHIMEWVWVGLLLYAIKLR